MCSVAIYEVAEGTPPREWAVYGAPRQRVIGRRSVQVGSPDPGGKPLPAEGLVVVTFQENRRIVFGYNLRGTISISPGADGTFGHLRYFDPVLNASLGEAQGFVVLARVKKGGVNPKYRDSETGEHYVYYPSKIAVYAPPAP